MCWVCVCVRALYFQAHRMDHIFTQVEPDIYATNRKYDLIYNQYRLAINITASEYEHESLIVTYNRKHSQSTNLHHANFENCEISSTKADQDRTPTQGYLDHENTLLSFPC